MKNLKLSFAVFIVMFTIQTNAQIAFNVSLGMRSQWQSQNHCNSNIRYYYLPEIEAYYDINSAVFIYNGPRGWVRTTYLPEYCRNYDVNRGYKVAINYTGYSPYVYFSSDREKYYRDNYRNYKEEYYRPKYSRRNDYVAVSYDDKYEKHHGKNHRNHHNCE